MYVPDGLKIREIRERRCLTQAELAGRVGVTRGAVTQWEAGYWLPKRGRLRKLAEALSCSVEDLCRPSTFLPTTVATPSALQPGVDSSFTLQTLDCALNELEAMIELLGTAREEFLGSGEPLNADRARLANNNLWAAELGLQHLHDAYRRCVDDQYKALKKEEK